MAIVPVPKTGRVGRYPKHNFLTRELVYTAQPFMIAPVLPGETLTNLYFESRVVSDPVRNPIIGWKKEYYFFYVPITLLLLDAVRNMFIDPANVDIAGTVPGSAGYSQSFYAAKGGVNYLQRALKVIVDAHFRDEGEVAEDYQLASGIPFVQIRDRMWLDSVTDKDRAPLAADPGAGTTPGNMEQLQALYEAYDQLRKIGVAELTFEDYLRSYGIDVPEIVNERTPELLARFSDWQYPTNTINPANGAPASALSWVFKNGNSQPKFFTEPGFVVGVSITRPKVYFGGLGGALAGHLTRAWDWLPNYLNEGSPIPLPETAFKRFAADTGPLGDRDPATDAYWVEMRDLFTHGDQFHNVRAFPNNGAVTDDFPNHLWALPPSNDMHKYKYPTEDMVRGLFVTPASSATVRQDGYVALSIKGRVEKDHPGEWKVS